MTSFVHKLTLLNRLLDATRECQTQYSTKKEIMTEKNSYVSCVCRQFEDVLSHGIKQRPIVSGIATIQNVTGLQLVDQDAFFWHCIQKHLSKHEVERFGELKAITTDIGRGRAWLRSSLNEHSLERVLQMILSDPMGLHVHYDKDAFILDEEKASLLPQIAAGLKSIVFCIKIDDPALNSFTQGSANHLSHKRSDSGGFSLPSLAQVGNILSHEVAMEEFPQASVPNQAKPGDKKRKKKARTKIITFGVNGRPVNDRASSFSSVDEHDISKSPTYSPSISTSSVESLSTRVERKLSHDKKRSGSREFASVERFNFPDPPDLPPGNTNNSCQSNDLERALFKHDSHSQFVDFDIYKASTEIGEVDSNSPSSSKMGNDLASDIRDLEIQDSNPFEQLVDKSESKNLNPSLSESTSESRIADRLESSFQLRFGSESETSSLNESADNDVKSLLSNSSSNQFELNHNINSDTGSIRSANMFTPPINDNDSIVSSSSLPNVLLHGYPSRFTPPTLKKSYSPSSLNADDSDSGSKSSELQKALVVLLKRKDELVEENKKIRELHEAEKEHSAFLRMENNRLKEQVENQEQMTKEDAQKQIRENDVLRNQLKKYVGAVHALQHGRSTALPQDGSPTAENVSSSSDTDHESEVKLYEQKLIEVAEMHGELMEFTESLHTRFLSALSLIHKMHDELVSLRGPMPTDDVIRAIEADKPRENISSLPQLARALVNVWVPSAFMQGTGPDSHHVYQIYICVGEDEWNVYRRYSDFHSLHTMLCKSYPQIQTFGFPPKKGIGNRNTKFVEERRKSFQKYVRLVMHNIFQNNAQLKANPTKSTLLHILPFFSDAGDQCRVIVGKNRK